MPPSRRHWRNALVIAAVLLGHVLVLRALHEASRGKPQPVIVPVRMLVSLSVAAPPVAASAWDAMALSALAVADVALKATKPPQAARPRPAQPALAPGAAAPARAARDAMPVVPEVLVRSSGGWGLHDPEPATSDHWHEAGRVVVRVLVDSDGRVLDAVLQRSSGSDRLDQAALAAVRQRRFDPMLAQGRSAGAQWIHVPVRFVRD